MLSPLYNLSCGTISNFFTVDEVAGFVKIYKKLRPIDATNNNCFGVDRRHQAYPWFKQKILDPIAKEFNPELKLFFSMLLDCTNPFDIHQDLDPLPDQDSCHFLSFLIPYAVDNDTSLSRHASTLIFDQITEPGKNTTSIRSIHKSKISHASEELLDQLSLKENLVWNPGDLLWWDSRLYHVSNNFLDLGFTSKQCIVLHTYTTQKKAQY